MITIKVKNIKWDLNGKMKKLNLPTEYTFEIEDRHKFLLDDYNFISDVLSDKFGFSVDYCTYNIID